MGIFLRNQLSWKFSAHITAHLCTCSVPSWICVSSCIMNTWDRWAGGVKSGTFTASYCGSGCQVELHWVIPKGEIQALKLLCFYLTGFLWIWITCFRTSTLLPTKLLSTCALCIYSVKVPKWAIVHKVGVYSLNVPFLPLHHNINLQIEQGNVVLNKNMPFTSGNIKWAKEVLDRLQMFWSNFASLRYL